MTPAQMNGGGKDVILNGGGKASFGCDKNPDF